MKSHITLRDIAKSAGVSLATVSRALRDDPTTAAKTREHVQKIAKDLGYRPDPALQVLIERRWRGRRSDEGFNLAFIYDGRGFYSKIMSEMTRRFKESARNLGYTLIPIDLREFANVQKLIHRLESQGVAGVVFALLPSVPYEISAVCERFAAVSVNVSSIQPDCPLIMHDEFRTLEQIWKRLEKLGYERVGVIFEEHPESFSMDQRLGAVYCRQRYVKPARNRLPILFFNKDKPDKQLIEEWIRKHEPDVVLGDTHHEYDLFKSMGFNIPEDFAFASVNMWDKYKIGQIAGYFRDNVVLFERGLHLLNLMIRSGATGVAQRQLVEMVFGDWNDGESLPAVKSQEGVAAGTVS